MGEAGYYLTARWNTHDDLDAQKDRITAFLDEGVKAQDWWQEHRRMDAEPFFKEFESKFPTVFKYLQTCIKLEDPNNEPARVLNFPDEDVNLKFANGWMSLSGIVWHLADWDPFRDFLKSEFGAEAAGWVSDEYLDPWSCIEMS